MDESSLRNIGGNFGENLRKLRKQHKLSLIELGEKAGISFSHLSRYERGVSKPNPAALESLSLALQVPVAELVAESKIVVGDTDPEIRQQLHEVEQLPEAERQIVKRLLGAFLFQHRVKNLSAHL